MTDDRWIWIPNWDDFQHYKTRDPLWIKNYTRLMSKDSYITLTWHQRGVLHGLWLLYARSNRQLRHSTSTLYRQLGQRVLTRDLNALQHAGFIEVIDGSVLAKRLHDASPEKSREEKISPKSPLKPKPSNSGWHDCTVPGCSRMSRTPEDLRTHLETDHEWNVTPIRQEAS